MKTIHVVTVPPQLDITVLDKLLGGIETTLTELGAGNVWIDLDSPALAVMAALPDDLAGDGTPTRRRADGEHMLKTGGLFEVYQDGGEHHWVLRDCDGQIMARNGGYVTRTSALHDIERLRVTAPTANIVEVEHRAPDLLVDDRVLPE